jgi:hypothetical protein
VGKATGEADSSVQLPPSTAKTLTALNPASTIHKYLPLGDRRTSNGRRPVGFLNGVLPSNVSVPSEWI